MNVARSFLATLLVGVAAGGVGCSSLTSRMTSGLAQDLASATLNHDDPETVRQGAPAFLLLADGLIQGSPDSEELLLAGAQLYGAYVTAFVEDHDRAVRLSDRSLEYARRALCLRSRPLCSQMARPYDEFVVPLGDLDQDDVAALYGFATAWARWIQVQSGDWNAVAQIPKVQATLRRVVELQDGIDGGNAHVYLGVLLSQLPAALGGQPEEARVHFERAIEISGGRNLLAKVLFAQQYARLVFDRPLHDELLREVIAADPRASGQTLINVLAQEQAISLLQGSADYF
ncbi:TRAP transporter TatT component family protein [Myxococcota bacterium]|nr:TRAP transporter TatT component family protein [Myxococcota bacterium]